MDLRRRPKPPPLPRERKTGLTRESPEFSDRWVGRNPGELELTGKIGVWYDVVSTLIQRVRFDWYSPWTGEMGQPPPLPGDDPRERTGYLSVEMLSLAVIGYPDVPYSDFEELLNSSSKGMWLVNSPYWHGNYDEVRPAQRKVTAEMKGQREPRRKGGRRQGHTFPGHPKPPKLSRPGSVRGD